MLGLSVDKSKIKYGAYHSTDWSLHDNTNRSIFMPPTLKKLKGHNALGLSVLTPVRPTIRPLQI